MCSARSTKPNPSCRICALALRKLRARTHLLEQIVRESARRSGSAARTGPAARAPSVQFSMICEGSSTKSHATLVPARLRTSTRLSR